MKKTTALVGLVLALLFSACSDSSDTPPAPVIISIDIEPKTSQLDIGTTQQYKVLATYSDNSFRDVTNDAVLVLENDSVIIVPVDNNGSLSFARAVKVGDDNLVASLSTFSTKASVKVTQINLVSILLTPNDANLSIANVQQYKAVGTYDNGTSQDLTDECTWTSSNPEIATVSSNGEAVAVFKGNTLIHASLDSVDVNVTLHIYDSEEILYISVSPQDETLFLGTQRYYYAQAHYIDGAIENVTKEVTWLLSNYAVAKFDLDDKNKLIPLLEGDVTVIASHSYKLVGGTEVYIEKVDVDSLVMTPQDITLEIGESRNYFTEVLGTDGKLYSINQSDNQYYSSDDTKITYFNREKKGNLIALSEGTTTLRSTFNYEGNVYTTATTITVIP